ncbi:MAG: nicotinate (nicotinamide) nucleotide adenylyltransferase [Candidatus Howiella sp.]
MFWSNKIMKKIVMLGGSFNPPHNGHLRLLRAAGEEVGADLLLMMPTLAPPHKSAEGLASARDRYNMCALCADEIGAKASDMELVRGGKSYTVDTLLALHEEYGACEIYLTMGADMLVTLKDWRRYEEILLLCRILAVTRAGTQDDRFADVGRQIAADGGQLSLFSLPPDGISSTDIRARVRAGQPIHDLVPDAVAAYIVKNKLYV